MLLSNYILPTLKEVPAEASITSHQLMLRAGMIRQLAAGIYNWLPLGLAVLKKIEQIVREEMNKSAAVEILIPCIQPLTLWQQSGRFAGINDLTSEMLRMKDRGGNDLVFTPTAEEAVVQLIGQSIKSYKDLPKNLYQINWKFRDELRPRYGVMRGREFLMKDSYSFHIDQECALTTYNKMLLTYINIFKKMKLIAIPVSACSGAIGGNYSHEFHVLADSGESKIYYETTLPEKMLADNFDLKALEQIYAAAEEKHDPANCKIPMEQISSKKGIEVGQIFYLGDKYSKAMNLKIQDKNRVLKHPEMGCYGIGISRLVAALIEANHDEKGIIWPVEVAPFTIMLLNLNPNHIKCNELSIELYMVLKSLNIDVLYDDTDDSTGIKFAKADLIGIPWQIIIGPKNADNKMVELKNRRTYETQALHKDAVIVYLKSNILTS